MKSGIVINLPIAFVLAVVISWTYRKTYRGLSYSVSFSHTLTLLCMVTALVMMVIGNSIARAFGLVGALSIIRFRTPVKDARDVAFVFFALATGMAVGTAGYTIAIAGVTVISLIILIMHRFRLGEKKENHFLLRLRVEASSNDESIYQDVFNRYLKQTYLINIMTIQQDSKMELLFSIIFKDLNQQGQLMSHLNSLPGVEEAMFFPVDGVPTNVVL